MQNPIKISDNERKCLEVLVSIYEDSLGDQPCTYFRYIAKRTEFEEKKVRRYVRSLARKGLALYVKGLFDDDGMVAGSGYRATEEGIKFVNPPA